MVVLVVVLVVGQIWRVLDMVCGQNSTSYSIVCE
jgi:hypothetical protein